MPHIVARKIMNMSMLNVACRIVWSSPKGGGRNTFLKHETVFVLLLLLLSLLLLVLVVVWFVDGDSSLFGTIFISEMVVGGGIVRPSLAFEPV